MTVYEFEHILRDAHDALNGIVGAAERFATDNFGTEILGTGGRWSDACGKRIGAELVASVERAVCDELRLYDCAATLERIAADVAPVLSVLDEAKRELQ